MVKKKKVIDWADFFMPTWGKIIVFAYILGGAIWRYYYFTGFFPSHPVDFLFFPSFLLSLGPMFMHAIIEVPFYLIRLVLSTETAILGYLVVCSIFHWVKGFKK